MATVEDELVSQEALAGEEMPEAPPRTPLGQLLIQAGFLTQVQLDDALYEGSRTGERLGEVVVRRGLASEDDVARLLAEQWDLDYVERSSIWFDANALARLSREDAQRLEALPTRVEGGRVVVAVAEPTEQRLAALRDLIGEETVMIVVPKSALDAGLRSDLLRSSARGQFGPPPEDDDFYDDDENEPELEPAAEADAEAQPEAGHEGETEANEEYDVSDNDDGAVALAEVTQLPVNRDDDYDDDDQGDAVALLADEAKAVAERLAAQAAAVKAEQKGLKVKSEKYESRIRELEEALGDAEQRLQERTDKLNSVRDQLAQLLTAFDDD